MANLDNKNLFNIDLLCLNKENSKLLKEVKVGNIFETNSKIFSPTGIYSTEIFGPLGSNLRNEQFGYINLGVEVLHPYVYITLCALAQKYEQVMEGKKKAVFDNKIKDMVISTTNEGNTGYHWLLTQLDKIQWDDRGSDQRRYRISLIKKYLKGGYTCTRWPVLPAGLRDYVEDDNGAPSEDEINNIYRKLLGTASMVRNTNIGDNYFLIDPIRLKLQKILVEIWEHFKTLLDGKQKFIQGKFAKRALRYGTRNVITPAPANIQDLSNDEDILTINHVTTGIYQYIKAIAPIAMNRISSLFVNQILNPNSDNAYLFNPKTLEPELVTIAVKKRDEWLTMEGLNDIMNKLAQSSLRLEPVRVDKYFMAVVWDNGKNIKVFLPSERIPEDLDRKYLRPITYAELFFISVYSVVPKYPGFFTRYPVAGFGGIVPCKIKLKTTVKPRTVTLEFMGQSKIMKEYPILDKLFVESLSIHDSHLALLGADFDGDCCIGCVIARFNKNNEHIHYLNNQNLKDNEVPVVNKKTVYSRGLINLRDFPRGKLIKIEGNKEYYEVPDSVEVLTVWNGETKWVHPESYSIHKNLKMLSVKTKRGNTIECSNDHSLVTVDENINYVRSNPRKGMSMPKLKNAVNNYVKFKNYKKHIYVKDKIINLNHDMGYLFGAIIGDGWVNKNDRLNEFMLSNNSMDVVNKITEIIKVYGYDGKPYTLNNEHDFNGYKRYSTKTTWNFKPIANLLRKYIGLGAYNKKLPSIWTKTSAKFRWGLLAGLIDTDGTLISVRDNYALSYCTVSEDLAYDIVALGNSLGLNVGITIMQRKKKDTREYYLSFRVKDNIKLKKHLKLLVKEKYDKLQQTKDIKEDILDLLPTITIDRAKELRSYITYDNDKLNYGRISDSLRRSLSHEEGCHLVRKHYLEIYEKYKNILSKDEFWNKLYKIALDKNIEWEIISSVEPIEYVTEAYDLTTPPHCTFVMQNGIVVYDTCSLTILYTDESIKEINEFLDSPAAYLTPTGDIAFSSDVDNVGLVMKYLTE